MEGSVIKPKEAREIALAEVQDATITESGKISSIEQEDIFLNN